MNLAALLDATRSALLRRRLLARLPGAPASGLLSICLDLGPGEELWLNVDPARPLVNWWARPAAGESGDYRLALGNAMSVVTAGAARFAALQAAFTGLAPVWLHDDCQRTGVVPVAHVGFAFDEEAEIRDDLPNARLLVPAIVLHSRAGRRTAVFSCAVSEGEAAIERWAAELRSARPAAAGPPAVAEAAAAGWRRRRQPLADRAFVARTRAALAEIAAGDFDKLVLARSVHFDSATPIAVSRLLAALADGHPECTIYGVGQHRQCFVGATPERLVSLDKQVVEADALAGTAWLFADPLGHRSGSPVLQSDKNSREQQLVVDAVRAALAPLCSRLAPPQAAEMMSLGDLQHLRTRVVGRARTGTGLFDLIACLHPTPAVGGAPGSAARRWLRQHGDRRAAWYTGGIGWIDRDGDGEVAVALRCARIRGHQAELFAGAGIVAGSVPAQELAETEAKLAVIAAALRQAHRPDYRDGRGEFGGSASGAA
ncbi:MAG: isochorismate synthase [Rhodobacteraceae bacterium]|nr:isochorismate synthase [Paracoccaceae bacterium]